MLAGMALANWCRFGGTPCRPLALCISLAVSGNLFWRAVSSPLCFGACFALEWWGFAGYCAFGQFRCSGGFAPLVGEGSGYDCAGVVDFVPG